MMRCASCQALAAENAQMKEEIAAWQAHDRDARAEAVRTDRLDRWATAFGLTQSQALVLMLLVDRAGSVVRHDQAVQATRDAPSVDPLFEPEYKLGAVHVSRIRKALGLGGARDGIRSVWGCGWILEPALAGTLRARAGDA